MHRDRQRRRRRLLVLLLVALALLLWWCHRPPPLVIGTFNIRLFPDKQTDPAAVAAAIAELDADAFAVQEIIDRARFEQVLQATNRLTGRSYALTLSPSCRGRKGSDPLNLGVVYDAARIELAAARPLSEGKSCPQGQPPGSIAALRPRGGPPLTLVSVHLTPSGDDEASGERRRQWRWLADQRPRLEAEFGAPVVVAGDFNSTGFLVPGSAERRFIDELIDAHDLALPTATIGCSEYWQPRGKTGPFEASLLDHIVLPSDLEFSRPEVLGMCAALACAPQAEAPQGYHTISDHCPVRVALHR